MVCDRAGDGTPPFCGLQGSGKTTFYNRNLATTHLRISMDMLKTRRREQAILEACLKIGQRCVVDNTNPTPAERAPYIGAAHARHFKVIAYYFAIPATLCLERNAAREGKAHIIDKGIWATSAKLSAPRHEEGFVRIYWVNAEGEACLHEECAT
jgi:predicted kinase